MTKPPAPSKQSDEHAFVVNCLNQTRFPAPSEARQWRAPSLQSRIASAASNTQIRTLTAKRQLVHAIDPARIRHPGPVSELRPRSTPVLWAPDPVHLWCDKQIFQVANPGGWEPRSSDETGH